MSKKFIITIDTEGDGQWNPEAPCSTANAKYIPRFQELSEKYGFYPTWLTNYEMVNDPYAPCPAAGRGRAHGPAVCERLPYYAGHGKEAL